MTTNRAVRVRLILALACLALVLPARAGADGATIDKTGWWNRANTPVATPAGPVTVPPPPGVPEGDLAVGAAGGDPSAVAAVGIQPADAPGATVERFTMTMREDPDADGNQNAAGAAIVACPIVEFWAGGENADWETRPVADCEVAQAEGVRDEDGTWTFDLAAIGALWFDPFAGIRADGVLLMEQVDAPQAFQVVFLGAEDIDIVLEVEPAPDAEDDPFTFDDPPADAGLNSGPSGGGSSIFSPPVVTSPPTTSAPRVTAAPATPTPIEDDTGSGDEVAGPPIAADPVSSVDRRGELAGNLPPGAFVFALVALAVLGAMSYWLGPAGQPITESRQRGVSRALDARARANSRSVS